MAQAETGNKLELWEDIAEGRLGDESIINSDYFREYLTRLQSNRDMHTLITGEGETGVGKTTLAIANCWICDLHGFTVDKVKYSVPEFNTAYFDVDPGAWLLADDVQKWMDKRTSMRGEQREQTTDIQANRVRQVFVVWTAPSKSWLDKRLGKDIIDYWIQCLETEHGEAAGKGRIYRVKDEEHYNTELTTKTEVVSWPILDDYRIYQEMHEKKLAWLQGEMKRKYVHVDEFEEAKKNFWNKATKKARYSLVKSMFDHDITQTKIAKITQEADDVEGITQSRVSQMVNSDSFEEVYST